MIRTRVSWVRSVNADPHLYQLLLLRERHEHIYSFISFDLIPVIVEIQTNVI